VPGASAFGHCTTGKAHLSDKKIRNVDLVGFATYNRCPSGNVEYVLQEMKINGAEVAHLATGMIVGYPSCPRISYFTRFIKEEYGMGVVVGTHPIPQRYYTTHLKFGSWDPRAWKELIAPTLSDEKTRLAYD